MAASLRHRFARTALGLVLAWLGLSAVARIVRVPAALGAAAAYDRTAIAIIVNPRNGAPDPSFADLRTMFTLERQFWPDGHRITLFLPPPSSPPKDALLERLYAMSDFELRKYWVGKLFRGAIPSIPSTLHSVGAAIAAVRESEGGMSAVLAADAPATVRVLRIDGKKPTDPGYPLVVERSP
jgi:hypothetical protein